MSRLIKGDDNTLFQIESFEVEEISEDPFREENFKEKLARIEKEAYEKGFEQGQKDGLSLEKKQMEEKARQLDTLFSELTKLKTELCSQTELELLKLSILIAKKIIQKEVKTDSGIIGNTIRAALKSLVDKHNIRILINPDDMEEVKKLLPELTAMTKGGRFQLIEDNVIEAGGCILETGFGKINATIEDQLGETEKELELEFQSNRNL